MISTDTGILFVNLGSPSSYRVKDVRRYLSEFLMDSRVLDVPYPIRKLIVSLFILPFRPKKSAEAYKSIWWEEGSPLIVLSQRFLNKMKSTLPIPMQIAMRYGSPSIRDGMYDLIHTYQIRKLLLVPMYPHYAMSTTETVVEKTRQIIQKYFRDLELTVFPPFYKNPFYIDALAKSIKPFINQKTDHILFSYHGIPERHLKKTDPTGTHCLQLKNCCEVPSVAHKTCYRHQVYETSRLVAGKLGFQTDRYTISFQSRLGKDSWTQPFTDRTIIQLAESGIKNLVVVSPAFMVDCLETLEELGIRGRDLFLRHGGERFELIPCLNDNTQWIHNFTIMLQHFLVDHGFIRAELLKHHDRNE
jgi:ferrochelatase